jgi:LysM repeat protein
MAKRVFQCVVILVILVASFGAAGSAGASSSCSSYITVQWGDTLSGIAVQCGTTVNAIRAANPGLGWWVYAGQVLYIPTGSSYVPVNYPAYGSTYTVRHGDTLGNIAVRAGCSLSALLAVNPQIQNPSLIYVGQVINLPAGAKPPGNPTPPPPNCNCPSQPKSPLDSYSDLKIAYEFGLFVRAEPGGRIIASGRNNSAWLYDPNSVFTDSKGRVWVKVHLYPAVKGYSSGWMMVRDQLGKYFTNPPIG